MLLQWSCSLTHTRTRTRTRAAAGKSSGWASGDGAKRNGSSGKGAPKQPKSSGSSSKRPPPTGSPAAAGKKPSSGQGFAPPAAAAKQRACVYRITPPVTPQLLDELSGWEVTPAPLWETFTGHCEGTWLGQYSAFTPWGGDPEPVWADDSGAYLTHAFCRVTEERQAVPVDAVGDEDEAEEPSLQEQQQQSEVLDLLVRTTARSASISSLIGGMSYAAAGSSSSSSSSDDATAAAAAAAAAGGGDAPTTSSADADSSSDVEALAYNVGGCVVFNGGSYSLGPEAIDVPEPDEAEAEAYADALEEAAAAAAAAAAGEGSGEEGAFDVADPLSLLPFSTAVIEQALVSGGDTRLRLVATLKLRRPPGQELDIEVARLLLHKEHWYTDSTGASASSSRLSLLPSHQFDVPVTQLRRPQPADLGGTWNVFVTAANPAVEENPDTLQDETVLLYSSREERQHWHVPTLTSPASPSGSNGSSNGSAAGQRQAGEQQEDEDDGSGGSFWLPGGAVVTLRMVASSSERSSSGSNGNGQQQQQQQRGLLVGLHMLDSGGGGGGDGGSALFVEREYDASGALAEVRQGSAVKGGWSGGRM